MRKFLSVVLTLAMVLSTFALCIVPAAAADVDVEVGKVENGYKPTAGAIAITSGEEFAAMDPNGNYYLANDITVTTSVKNFYGTFDGCGHTITTSVALFKTVQNATLKNFTVEGDVKGFGIADCMVGGDTKFFYAVVACLANGNSTFKNIYNKADITEETSEQIRIATIAGSTTVIGNLVFEDIVNDGDVNSVGYAGGVYGWASIHNLNARFERVVNNGNVVATGSSYAGGIAARVANSTPDGANLQKVDFIDCVNTGDVSASTGAAGICEYISGSITFTRCTNYGDMDGNTVAGIVSRSEGKENELVTAIQCVNYGTLTVRDGGKYAAGIFASGGDCVFFRADKCVNYGKIVSTSNKQAVGGIFGEIKGYKTDDTTSHTNLPFEVNIENHKGYTTYVTNCVNFGDFDTNDYAGGIGGTASYDKKGTSPTSKSQEFFGSVYIANCANFGHIKSNSLTSGLVVKIAAPADTTSDGQQHNISVILENNLIAGKITRTPGQTASALLSDNYVVKGSVHDPDLDLSKVYIRNNIIACEFDAETNSVLSWTTGAAIPAENLTGNVVYSCTKNLDYCEFTSSVGSSGTVSTSTDVVPGLASGEFVNYFNEKAGETVLFQDLSAENPEKAITPIPVLDPRDSSVALNEVLFDGTNYYNPTATGTTADAPMYVTTNEDGIYGTVANIAAGETVYVAGRVGGMIAKIENAAGVTVTVNGTPYTADADGVITFEVPRATMPMMPVVLEVKNASNAVVNVEYEFTFKPGTDFSCPLTVELGEVKATVTGGGAMYYTLVATGKGTIKVTLDSATAGQAWNSTTGVYAEFDENGVAEVEVRNGQTVMISVGRADWTDGDISFTTEFVAFGTPSTGDNLAYILAAFAVSAMAIVAVAVLPKKREER